MLRAGSQYADFRVFTTGTRVYRGGLEFIQFEGFALSGTAYSGEAISVTGGGRVQDTTISRDGRLIVDSDGATITTVISNGGLEIVNSSGTASGVTVLSGGELAVGGGTLTGVKVAAGGKIFREVLSKDVTSRALVVSSGLFLEVLSGSKAINTTVSSGSRFIYAGGNASNLTIRKGGIEEVASGISVSGLMVGAGATLVVSSGGKATNTALLQSGTEDLEYGATAGGDVTFSKNAELILGGTSAVSLRGFGVTDRIDLHLFRSSGIQIASFKENAAKTQGTLTLVDGSLELSVTLFGQYVAAGFRLTDDGAGGTTISYKTSAPASELALPHG